MKGYKFEKRTVWRFDYHWTDDYNWNLNQKDIKGHFIGTEKDFKQMIKDEQWGNGFSCWNVKKRHATKTEYEEMLYWL